MSKAGILFAAIWLTCVDAHSLSIDFPKFGPPHLVDGRLVFEDVGRDPRRILCIDQKSGKKLWEIKTNDRAAAHRISSNEILVSDGQTVSQCELKSGVLRKLFDVSLTNFVVRPGASGLLLIHGERAHSKSLQGITTSAWKIVWEGNNIETINQILDDRLICSISERMRAAAGGYHLVNSALVAIATKTGTVLWKNPLEDSWPDVAVVGNHLFYSDKGSLKCVLTSDGSRVNSFQVTTNQYASFSIAPNQNTLLLWAREGRDVFSGHVIYSLSVPDLQKSLALKPDWYASIITVHSNIVMGETTGRIDAFDLSTGKKLWKGGQWNWDGVHDGKVYFSEMGSNEKTVTVNEIIIATGRRRKLFQEELPPEKRINVNKIFDDHYSRQTRAITNRPALKDLIK
jgi:hypothetical protein